MHVDEHFAEQRVHGAILRDRLIASQQRTLEVAVFELDRGQDVRARRAHHDLILGQGVVERDEQSTVLAGRRRIFIAEQAALDDRLFVSEQPVARVWLHLRAPGRTRDGLPRRAPACRA